MPTPNSGCVICEIEITSAFLHPGRKWRRSFYMLRFVLLKKTSDDGCHVSTSTPYAPLPQSPTVPSTSSSTSAHLAVQIDTDDEGRKLDKRQSLRESIPKIVEKRDLHALKRIGGIETVARELDFNLETGIATVPNQANTVQVHRKSFLFNLLKAWKNPTILLLLLTAVLSFAIEIWEEGPEYGWHDGVAILVAVFLLAIFRSVSNFHHERELEKKRQEKQKFEVKVVRNGDHRRITASDLVMGDVVDLVKGDMVPADGLFVKGDSLVLDEVLKNKPDCHENPFLICGSKVTQGSGRMLAISEGASTASDDPGKRTFLASQIDEPYNYMEILSLLVSVLISFVVLIRLVCSRQHENDNILPELKGNVTIDVVIKIFEGLFWKPTGRVHILAGALTAIVIGIQHWMPFVITVSLSFWNTKIEFSKAKPQNLSACGTMGLVTVICLNATGGLFSNQLEVKEFFIGEDEDMFHPVDSEPHERVLQALHQGIGAAKLVPEIPASSTNNVDIAAWANSRWGINMELSSQHFSVIDHGRAGTNANCIRVLVKKNGNDDKILHMHLKGDAPTILKFCSCYYNGAGEVHSMNDKRRRFEERLKNVEMKGLTPLAFACKQVKTRECNEEGSILLAVVGLGLKDSARNTIQDLKNAGVSIKLVSQDEIRELRKIARDLEIIRPDSNDIELEGEQIRNLNEHERLKKIQEAIVIANCTAEDMLRVVESLQKKDHVVAFFGGLTTRETQALEKADLGITRETRNTEMTRNSSDIIISDECSLLPVRKLGRCAHDNIQKFTQLQMTACISGLLINLIAAICLWDSPLTPVQLMWSNFLTCLMGGLMMVMELSESLIASPPATRTQPLITKPIWIKIAAQALSQTCLLMVLHLVGNEIMPRINEETWKPLVFNSFLLCQMLNQLGSMGILRGETLKAILHHYWFLLGLGSVMIMQVIVVTLMKSLAGCRSLNMVDWVLSLIVAALSWGLGVALEFISISFSDWPSTSHDWGYHLGFSWRNHSSLASVLASPLSILFVVAIISTLIV